MSVDNYKFVHKQQFTTLYGTLSITSALYTTTHSKLWVVCSRIMIQLVTLGITDVSWRQSYCVRNIVICTLLRLRLTQSLGVIQNHVITSIINGMLGPFYVMENMPPTQSVSDKGTKYSKSTPACVYINKTWLLNICSHVVHLRYSFFLNSVHISLWSILPNQHCKETNLF